MSAMYEGGGTFQAGKFNPEFEPVGHRRNDFTPTIKTGRGKLDSLKIRVHEYKILDPRLNGTIFQVNHEGEILSEYRNKRITVKEQGITTSYALVKLVNTTYCVIMINAKVEKERYMSGLTLTGIQMTLNRHKIISVTLSELLQSNVTDVDICADARVSMPVQDAYFSELVKLYKASPLLKKGYRFFGSSKNKGLQFSTRENASPSNPFFKIYSKSIELNGSVFADAFGLEIDPMLRFEATIKDKKHAASITKETGVLIEMTISGIIQFLYLEEGRSALSVMNHLLCKHIETTPVTRLLLNCQADTLCLSILSHLDLSSAIVFVSKHATNKQQSHLLKKRLIRVNAALMEAKGMILPNPFDIKI